jgi:uncharacterized protein
VDTIQRPAPFFNRHVELEMLERGWNDRRSGGFAMVYGRRRLGKTYLLQRFFTQPEASGDAKVCCYYLADLSTAENQRLAFAERLLEAFPNTGYTPPEIAVSWNGLLRFASTRAREMGKDARVGLVIDEFPYLVAQTQELPSILQSWWDAEGLHSPLFVVLCGSQLSAMAALAVDTAPLYGRLNAGILRIEPMRYDDVAPFYEGSPSYGIVEKLLMYGAFGGTPRYHAMAGGGRPWREQIVDLLMRPGAPLESEPRFLLASEQIRDPAPYNSILGAIAHGRTQYGEIQNAAGIGGPVLAQFLKALMELGWIRKERSSGEATDRRSLYRLADPFLTFWYRFVAPSASALQFDDPLRVFDERVAPHLDDYMGWNVFEGVCGQWLQRHARSELGLTVRRLGRYWSRDGSNEIDLVADLEGGSRLFGECKWSARSEIGVEVYKSLLGKVAMLPEKQWAEGASYALFSVGGFTEDLRRLAESDGSLHLVDGSMMYSVKGSRSAGGGWSLGDLG